MTEAEWLAATEPKPMLEFLDGKTSDRKFRLLACACCRRIWDLLTDIRSQKVVEVVEGVLEGVVSELQLPMASDAAMAAIPNHLYGVRYAAATTAHEMPFGVLNACLQAAEARQDFVGERKSQTRLAHDIFGNPFRPVSVAPAWLTSDVVALAQGIYADRAFDGLPILADALQDAGCDNEDILDHCRGQGPHVRGWVVDLLLGKE